jgi:branched-chain amino acid transport system ATP-binding protein
MTLQVKGLVKHFDGVQAVRGIGFVVQPGECVAMIGPNGAGKSTSFACIAGQHRLTSGEVFWNGNRIDQLSPSQRLLRGIGRTFQVAQTFDALTVLQNLQLLMQAPYGLSAYSDINRVHRQQAFELLERVGLGALADADAQNLPYGAKKRLELAMALAGLQNTPKAGTHDHPQLLLLDEPAAGLAVSERAELMQLIKTLILSRKTEGGLAVLYTEHNMDAVFGVADRVLVLIDGEIAAQGKPQAIAQDDTVRRRYLGQWWSETPYAQVTHGAVDRLGAAHA